MKRESHRSISEEETHRIALNLGSTLPTRALIALSGELGAGKTTFVRGLAAGAAHIDPREVCSPTFTYLHIYTAEKTLYHFDLYRLPGTHAFLSAGFADFLTAEGICCIEWAEKISPLLPETMIRVHLSYLGQGERNIEIEIP